MRRNKLLTSANSSAPSGGVSLPRKVDAVYSEVLEEGVWPGPASLGFDVLLLSPHASRLALLAQRYLVKRRTEALGHEEDQDYGFDEYDRHTDTSTAVSAGAHGMALRYLWTHAAAALSGGDSNGSVTAPKLIVLHALQTLQALAYAIGADARSDGPAQFADRVLDALRHGHIVNSGNGLLNDRLEPQHNIHEEQKEVASMNHVTSDDLLTSLLPPLRKLLVRVARAATRDLELLLEASRLVCILAASSPSIHCSILMEYLHLHDMPAAMLRALARLYDKDEDLQAQLIRLSMNEDRGMAKCGESLIFAYVTMLHYERYDAGENAAVQKLRRAADATVLVLDRACAHLACYARQLFDRDLEAQSSNSLWSTFGQFLTAPFSGRTYDNGAANRGDAQTGPMNTTMAFLDELRWTSTCIAMLPLYHLVYLHGRYAVIAAQLHRDVEASSTELRAKRRPQALEHVLPLIRLVLSLRPNEPVWHILQRLAIVLLRCLSQDTASCVVITQQQSVSHAIPTSSSNDKLYRPLMDLVHDALFTYLEYFGRNARPGDALVHANCHVALQTIHLLFTFELSTNLTQSATAPQSNSSSSWINAYCCRGVSAVFSLFQSQVCLDPKIERTEWGDVLVLAFEFVLYLIHFAEKWPEQAVNSLFQTLWINATSLIKLHSNLREGSRLAALAFPIRGMAQLIVKAGGSLSPQRASSTQLSGIVARVLEQCVLPRAPYDLHSNRIQLYVENPNEAQLFNHLISMLVRKFEHAHLDPNTAELAVGQLNKS